MDGSKPSTGENPPVKSPKKRLNKAHNPPKPVFPNTSPAATNQRKGEGITVAHSSLRASKNSKVNFGTKKVIPLHGDCSSSQNAHPHQKSAISTVEINVNDRLQNASNIELAGDRVLAGQSGNVGYQNARTNEDISLAPSILYGYQSTNSILKSLNPGTQNSSDFHKNDNPQFGQTGPQPLIGNLSPPSEEQVSTVSAHSSKTIDHIDQLTSPVLHHLAGQEVPVNQLLQNQYQTTPGIQEIDPQASNPIFQGPIPSNIQFGDSAVTELSGARPNVKDTYGALMGNQSGLQISHDHHEGNSPPPPPTVTHSYVTRLRARHAAEIKPIAFTLTKITTKQGQPAVIFKKEDYMVRFADRCKFIVVGKYSNTMPRMEIIRKSFIAQTELRRPVKIAHFNARTVYIDLENEYDHSTVWGKQYMYIQGQMMKLEAWSPAFKPNEDSPIVLVWVVIPELPWHLYYMEILTPLLSPIGKALYLDLASFQKNKGKCGQGIPAINPPAQLERSVDPVAQDHPIPSIPPSSSVDCGVIGGMDTCQGKLSDSQEGVPKGEGLPYVLHECAKAQLDDHRIDQQTPTTTLPNSDTQQVDQYDSVTVEEDSESLSSEENPSAQMKALHKGKAKFLSPQSQEKFRLDPTESPSYRLSVIANPSLSQPSLTNKELSSDGNETDIPTNDKPPKAKTHKFTFVSPSTPRKNHLLNPLDMVMEECPQQDEYRPIESEDESAGNHDDDIASNDDGHEKEEHCELLIAAVNGEQNKENDASATLSARKSPSPRLTRSRAARIRSSNNSHLNSIKIQLSIHQASANVNDKIWVFWDKEFNAKVLDHDEQQLSLEMKHVENGNLFHLTVIYAKCKPILRRPLWEVLRHKSTTCNVPWCVIRDFNVIASVEEKIGGIPYQMSKSLDFLSMMEDCGLMDLGFYGSKVTWSNERGQCAIVWKSLDRGLANDLWLEDFPAATITHLASARSDHNPLLLELHTRQDNGKKYFKFLKCWVDNKSFLPLVSEIWNREVRGNPMWVFHQKLKALSHALSPRSRQQYGDIFQKTKEYEQKVKDAELIWAQTNNDADRISLNELKAQYVRHLKVEQDVLKQKTQLQWFKEGDAN
ncbi:hypothetical protein A4A49_00874 [Nicotiana attenuata]|uniref:DUF4283 domain-containing protein n=1 Tax=Nicotiana attenuata TaxID=49451 RepID=A0A1J6JFN7_NICAT|nr:hypothetical protein A4A49_00874 [Nicotiana attenuata]